MTPPAAPLEAAERERLSQWPQRLRIAVTIGVGLMLVALAGFALGEPPWQVPLASLALAVLLVAGISAQVLVRCPRCDRPIGLGSAFVLPERCRNCGVELAEPGGQGG
jgi:hypothetical protein